MTKLGRREDHDSIRGVPVAHRVIEGGARDCSYNRFSDYTTERFAGAEDREAEDSAALTGAEDSAALVAREAATEMAIEAAALRDLLELQACGMRVRWPPWI